MCRKYGRIGLLSLLVWSAFSCSRKQALEAAQAAPENLEPYVHMMSDKVPGPVFEIKSTAAEIRNGRLNLVLVSESGSMIQINDLPQAEISKGTKSGELFRLVYMPGGMQPACVGQNPQLNEMKLSHLPDGRWRVKGNGQVQCSGNKKMLTWQFLFEMPEPEFTAPNN
ncbi:MAG: hypothetical protein ACK417_08175 [Bacteroidia bacterium]